MTDKGYAISILTGMAMALATLLTAGLRNCDNERARSQAQHESEMKCMEVGGTMADDVCIRPVCPR